MKDITQKDAEVGRPDAPALQTINYCLEQIFADTHASLNDTIVKGLTFEMLIGALLQARDLAKKEEA
jgi:hypothetical protein